MILNLDILQQKSYVYHCSMHVKIGVLSTVQGCVNNLQDRYSQVFVKSANTSREIDEIDHQTEGHERTSAGQFSSTTTMYKSAKPVSRVPR